MQPNLIRSSAEASLTLLEFKGRGSPEAFLLAWVAWEGLKVRIVVVGLALQGFQVKDIYDVLSSERVHTLQHYRGLFRSVFGDYPESAKGVGRSWTQVEEFRDLRNRYVHGTRGAAPLRLEAATHLITERVLDPNWLANLAIAGEEPGVRLGDPYRRLLRPRREVLRSTKNLRELVDLARPFG